MKTKLSDLIISGILKRGIIYEAKTVDTEIDIPINVEPGQEKIVMIRFKCENMSLRIDKED